MSLEQTPLRGVVDNYGRRSVGGSTGVYPGSDSTNELAFRLTGNSLADGFIIAGTMPKGASVIGAKVIVSEAFDLAVGTIIDLGAEGAEVADGVNLVEADLETVGATSLNAGLSGTWAVSAYTPAETAIGLAFAAGSVADSGVGKATVIVEYSKVA